MGVQPPGWAPFFFLPFAVRRGQADAGCRGPRKATRRPCSNSAMSLASRSTSLTRWLTKMMGIAKASRSVSIKLQDVVPARVVDRVQRLVHQQHAGIAEQRAADRDALLLAARQARRSARQQRLEAEQRDDVGEGDEARPARGEARAVGQIVRDAEMRKQARLLEDVADAAQARRDVDPSRGVEEHRLVDRDAARGAAAAARR